MLRASVESLQRSQEFGFCNGLRGLAVLWVCSDHGMRWVQLLTGDAGDRLYRLWWPVALPASGEVGVDLFLALSGFLIGSALQREAAGPGEPAWGLFYVRRFFRIFPACASAMLATMVGDALSGSPASCPNADWRANIVVLNNMLQTAETCMAHTWSVAVELQLYMVTPILFAFASTWSSLSSRWSAPHCTIFLCVLGWLGCCLLRFHYVVSFDLAANVSSPRWIFFYLRTQYRYATYIAGVAAGVLVAAKTADGTRVVEESRRSRLLAGAAAAAAYLVLACACVFGGDLTAVPHPSVTAWYRDRLRGLAILHVSLLRPLVGAAAAALLALCALGHAPRASSFLSSPAWRPLAGLSYSMYLLQFVGLRLLARPFLLAVADHLTGAPLGVTIAAAYAAVALFVLGSIPLAFLNYTFVERPGIRLGKRVGALWSGARGAASAVPGSALGADQASPSGHGKLAEWGLKDVGSDSSPLACCNRGAVVAHTATSPPSASAEDLEAGGAP